MAMVSYRRLGVSYSYTPIALDKLDEVRLRLRADLAELKSRTGEEFILRTFYLGPRPKGVYSVPASTLKSNARAAKIGVYKVQKRGKYVYKPGDVRRFVCGDLKYYV